MILGNIVTDDSIEQLSIFKYYTFDNTIGMDESVPTLYIGYTNTKKLLGTISALSYKISKNKFWCNTKKENNKNFVKQYFLFQIYAHNTFINEIDYIFYDVFKPYSYHKKIINEIIKNKKSVNIVWTKGDMFYINFENIILGVSYSSLKFIGISPKRILQKFKDNDITCVGEKNLNDSIIRFGVVMDTNMYSPYLLNFS